MNFALLAFLLCVGSAFGFEATMTIDPPLIRLGESATLSIQVRDAKNLVAPALPNIPGLHFVGAGQSSQHSWVNGKADSFTAFNFQIYPQKTGQFNIGPFNYTVDGQTQTLQGNLNVVGTSGEAQQAQSESDLLFARLQMDRESAYVQEPFGLLLSIYSRQGVQLAGNINLQGLPETGLDGLQWKEVQGGREVINQTIYEVRRFQTRTRALSAGTFEFSPRISLQVVVSDPNNRSRSPFDNPFFNSIFQRTETRPVDLPVEKVAILIRSLPEENRPADFSGAVGQFDFQVGAQPLSVHSGDPITLTLTVSGDGNFDRVAPPSIPAGDSFRLYGETVRKQENNIVLFEQVISPRSAEVTEIPAIPFSFFDTQAGQYRMIRSTPIPITVTETSNSTAQVFASKNSVVLPPPETPFASESDLQRIDAQLKCFWGHIRRWLWIFPAALLAGLALFLGRRLHQTRRSDTARVRRQKAPRAARKALHAASQAQRRGDIQAFEDSLWNALIHYFGNRLNLPPGDVTSAVVLQALSRAHFDPERTNALRAIFEQLEASRYGRPGTASPEEMGARQNDLEHLLKQCEKTAI